METKADQTTFRSYLYVWSGQLVSLLGSSIAGFVIIWWITLQTGSAVYLSIASLFGFVPQVILTPFAGVLVDRWSRKALIGVADSLQALATIVIIFLFWLDIGSIWQILGLLALRSVFQAFHTPAVTAIIPAMVPKSKLSRINGLNHLFSGTINLIGPVIAAVLLELWKIGQILWIDALTFIAAVGPLLIIQIPSVRKKKDRSQEKVSFKQEFREGLAFIKTTRGLLALIMLATLLNFLLVPLGTLLPYYVKVDHLGEADDFAFVVAFSSGGTLAGGLLMSVIKGFKKKMVAGVSVLYVAFLGYTLVALTPTGLFWFMAIGSSILSFCFPLFNVTFRTLVQTIVPTGMYGRVSSVGTALVFAAMPLGMAISGPIAEFMGTANLFLVCIVVGVFALTLSWIFTEIRQVEAMEIGTSEVEPREDGPEKDG